MIIILDGAIYYPMKHSKDDFFEHIDSRDPKTIIAYRHRVKKFENYSKEKFGKKDIVDDFTDKDEQVDIFREL